MLHRPDRYAIETAATHSQLPHRVPNGLKAWHGGSGVGHPVSRRSFHLTVECLGRLKANRSPKAAAPISFIQEYKSLSWVGGGGWARGVIYASLHKQS